MGVMRSAPPSCARVCRWIFANVRSKWPVVLRKPSHLPELFSGYKASRALVYEVRARPVAE